MPAGPYGCGQAIGPSAPGRKAWEIRQLANELQLSIGTVSRALNDRPDVNPETRARVKAAAARAGLRPEPVGTQPAQRPHRHGRGGDPDPRFAPSADSGLFTVLEGVRRTLRRHALDLIVLFRGPDEDPLENLQRIVQRRIADGVIISETIDPRPAARLPQGRRRRLRHLRPQRRARRLSLRRLRLRGDGGRGVRGSSSATAIGGWRSPPTSEPLNYEAHRLAVFGAEAARLGLGARGGAAAADARGRMTEADARRSSPTGRRADRGARDPREHRRRRSTPTSPSSASPVGSDVSVVCTFPPSTPAGSSRRSRTSTPTSTRSAWRWPSSWSRAARRRGAPPASDAGAAAVRAARQPRARAAPVTA